MVVKIEPGGEDNVSCIKRRGGWFEIEDSSSFTLEQVCPALKDELMKDSYMPKQRILVTHTHISDSVNHTRRL